MMRAQLMRLLALTAVMFTASQAGAAPIKWGYDWSATPFVTAGSGKVTFSDESYRQAAGNSFVVAAQLQTVSSASYLTPDTFGPGDGNYSLSVWLKDIDSGLSGTLTFTGKLQGQFSQLNSLVSNTFNSPTVQSILLGYTTFIVRLDSYTPPGPSNQLNLGSIGATVEVSSLKPAQNTPEPSSMALAGLGLGAAGLAAWRRRRQQRNAS
ncbi:MAG: PEP-CTERM sorting domain-containing protein [Gemmataceae bacterium]